jgi:hypothetical protein
VRGGVSADLVGIASIDDSDSFSDEIKESVVSEVVVNEFNADNCLEPVADVSSIVTKYNQYNELDNTLDTDSLLKSDDVCDQLVCAIRSLRIRDIDGSGRSYDISLLEFHEVEFLFKHAERVSSVDYFNVVRELHAVKRRILNLAENPDVVDSTNIDTLINFAEEKYETSFGGVLAEDE